MRLNVFDPLGNQRLVLQDRSAVVFLLRCRSLSVFARRRRREVKVEAGSTMWLSILSLASTRWIKKPSSPASWVASRSGRLGNLLARAQVAVDSPFFFCASGSFSAGMFGPIAKIGYWL